jgi:hypothetical protein
MATGTSIANPNTSIPQTFASPFCHVPAVMASRSDNCLVSQCSRLARDVRVDSAKMPSSVIWKQCARLSVDRRVSLDRADTPSSVSSGTLARRRLVRVVI